MLGRFLEFSLATPDIRASLDFYTRLGFSQAQPGDARPHAYAVMTDGRIYLGLHQEPAFVSSLTFVRPDLLKHLAGLEGLGIRFEFRRLGNDVFNEIGWLDPSGHLIRLVEARTFSPHKRAANEGSQCGYFREIGLPAASPDLAKAHWEAIGFVGMDEPAATLPHIACTSDTIDIGLYEPAHLREPTLLFEVDDFESTLAGFDALGLARTGRVPTPLRQRHAVVLTAPEGTPLLITSSGED